MGKRFLSPLFIAGMGAVVSGLAFVGSLHAQVSVLSYHNDLRNTGQNLVEQSLTPASVNPGAFGKIFAAAVDGQVYAQPLYVPALAITAGTYQGTTHNTTFVATQHDSVYAFDTTSGAQLWTCSLINAAGGETTVSSADTGSADINPEIGVTSTPAIDLTADSTTNKRYIYVVAKSRLLVNSVPHFYFKLHAIDIASGAERGGSPVVIAETTHNGDGTYTYISGPSVTGTGAGAINGVVSFNAQRENQRPGLALTGGRLYIAAASHGDNGPYHGWVLSYDAATFQLKGAFNATPNGSDGGIWMSGGIPAVDAAGALYVSVGNGSFANTDPSVDPVIGDFDTNGFPSNHNYGDSVIKLVTDASTPTSQNGNGWGLKVADYFTAYNQRTLNDGDTDLGSGGVLLLPDSVGSAAHPHLLMTGGKEGRLYLIDRDNLGKFRGGLTGSGTSRAFVTTGDQVVQEQPNAVAGSLDSPAYFNGQFYYAGAYSSDVGKAFTIANGVFGATPASRTTDTYGYLGSSPSVSASSTTTNGIVWMIDRGTNQLRAYNATDLSKELYTSGQAGNSRDQLGTAVKFGVPTVADGRVLVGTSETSASIKSTLVCYGLLASTTQPPAQPLNLYAQTVSGGEIDLFWDGTATNASGYEVYVSLDPNNFSTTPWTTTAATAGSCAVNGLQLSTTYYFRVRAVNAVGSSAYSNTAATTSGVAPPVDFTNGFASSSQLFTAQGFGTTSVVSGNVLRITDGNSDENHAVWLNTAQNISKFTTVFDFQDTSAIADGFMFVIQNVGLAAKGAKGGELGYTGIKNSLGIKFDLYPGTASTTGYYLNGVSPVEGTAAGATSSGTIDVSSSGIDFHNGHPCRVVLTYDGTTLTETITDATTRDTFTRSYPLNLVGVTGSSTAYVGFTGGTGGLSAVQDILSWSFTPSLPVAPGAPTSLNAVGASATQINLAWTDNAANETGFRIERAAGGSNATFAPVGSVGANTTVFVDANLLTNTTYSYRVVASNAGLNSSPSNTVTLTTPLPPTTPSGAAATLVAANEIDFHWTDNSDNETGYRILRQTGDGEFSTLVTLPANTTSYHDTTVSPDTDYDYHIQAYNAAGYVDFTGFGTTTPSGVNIVSSAATAQESTATVGTIAVRRSNALGTPLTVNYTILTGRGQAAYGVRYTLSPAPANTTSGSIVIPANSPAATITVIPANDPAVLGSQSVTLLLAAGDGYSALGSSSATVTLLDSPINAWRIAQFGSLIAAQSPQAVDTADYDNDGLANILEYALGDNAAKSGDANQPKMAIEKVNSVNYLTLTFKCPYPPPTDISYLVESSANLGSGARWEAGVPVSGYPVNNGDGTQTVKVRSVTAVSGASQGFIRLRITRP